MKHKTFFVSLIVLLALGLSVAIVDAQGPKPGTGKAPKANAGTAFTYQGQLKNNSALVNGACDFQFSLFDDPSAGAQIGSTQTANGVSVTNGLFTRALDFGANAFTGDARWLQIAVACPSGGGLTALSPRQALTPAPLALALPGLFTQQNSTSPNLIGGFSGNVITPTLFAATISGGGANGALNRALNNYATVGGGYSNTASGHASTVGGGNDNNATNSNATIGGGNNNSANDPGTTVGGGRNNTANGLRATISGGEGNNTSNQYTTIGGGNGNYASGDYATVAGGISNVATDRCAIGGGSSNNAIGVRCTIGGGIRNEATGDGATVPGGREASASLYGQMSYASGNFANTGDAQTSTYVLRNQTANGSATELFLDGSSNRLTIAPNRTMTFDILIVARRDSSNTSAGYQAVGVIKNDGGATAIVGTVTKTTLGENDITWNVDVTADDTNDALKITVTGAASTTIRWVATVRTVEVAW